VLGFAPSVTVGLRTDLGRVAWVGGGAAALLLGVALALTRTAIARSRLEQEAERQKRLVALGQMSSVMAHELRNPLASLKGHAQLLVESLGEGSRERAKAERVVREAERIERLTVDLLDFVRDGPIDLRPVTPAALIERARELVPEAEIRLDLTGAPPALEVDPARLAAALGNLLRNARQASDQPAEVRVLTRADAVIIEVQDRGPGLPPGEEERIFDPFVTGRTWGTSLGLAVARRAAEQHGGTLRGETHPAGGALFRVTLPGAARTT
jgi:two-component system sensor histidine kinase HydH